MPASSSTPPLSPEFWPHARMLWRISPESDWTKAARAPATARWHTRGPDVLYTSTTEALAALEALAHLHENPRPHRLVSIDIPDGASIRRIAVETLPARWRSDRRVTRAIGNAWLRACDSDLLWVPSVHANLSATCSSTRHADGTMSRPIMACSAFLRACGADEPAAQRRVQCRAPVVRSRRVVMSRRT